MIQSLQGLSAKELFEMAEQRRVEEEAEQREALKQQVADLRGRMRVQEREHKKIMAGLEAEISSLLGRQDRPKVADASNGRAAGVSSKIVDFIRERGQASTKEIAEVLQNQGVKPKNLSQSMAYLKKRGEVQSIGHGVYRLPD